MLAVGIPHGIRPSPQNDAAKRPFSVRSALARQSQADTAIIGLGRVDERMAALQHPPRRFEIGPRHRRDPFAREVERPDDRVVRRNWQLHDWLDFRFDADRIAALVFETQARTIAVAALVTVTRDLADLFGRGALFRTGERQYTHYRLAIGNEGKP